jgi:hypothetical protein
VYSPGKIINNHLDKYAQTFGFPDINACPSGYLHFPDAQANPNVRFAMI